MLGTRRLAGVATALAIGGLGALPAGAAAAPVSCVFEGVAGNITPGVMLQGGGGTYDFASQDALRTRCGAPGGEVLPASIISRGSFLNVVCGTGTATSTPRATTVSFGGVTHTMEYVIEFRGFVGDIDVRSFDGVPDTLPSNGQVVIVPTRGTCASAVGITAFEANGRFHTL